MEKLEARIRALEDIEAIKELQYSYWRNVDLQRPDDLREVFYAGAIDINFQDMPVWNDREVFVAFYRKLGCNPARRENHFGSAPRISITGPDAASGHWRLQMFAYNYESRVTINVTGEYQAKYVRAEGRWWIQTLHFSRHSLYSEQIASDGALSAPEFGVVSAGASAHLFGEDNKA